MRTNQSRRNWQQVNFLKRRGQVRHLKGWGGHNLLVRLHRQRALSEFEMMGVRITWGVNWIASFAMWTKRPLYWLKTNPVAYAAGSFLNSWISVKASSTVVNWVANKGGHKYACSLLVKTGEKGIGDSLLRRDNSLKRANYSANSAQDTPLKLSLEDADERTTHRT
jgi:hypothetical protein